MGRSKRKQPRPARRGGPYVTDLPRIRDSIADQIDEMADTYEQISPTALDDIAAQTGFSEQMWQAAVWSTRVLARRARAPQAQLWWVTPRMAQLAAEAALMLPDWTPHVARPSVTGVVWWDRGTGLSVNGPGPASQVMGVLWDFGSDDGSMSITPILQEDDPGRPFGATISLADSLACSQGWQVGQEPRLWQMLGATWLLAMAPTVGVVHNIRFWARDPDRPFAKPTLPGTITQVTLREVDYGDPEIGGQPRARLDHRVLVRGYWRQQACGPKRRWRKPIYVAPHVRGPEGTPLTLKDQVHVWRR